MNNFPNDDKTQCYVQCMLSKMGLFDGRTGFNVERLVSQLSMNKRGDIKPEIERCTDDKFSKTNICEWAYRGFYCIRRAELTLRLWIKWQEQPSAVVWFVHLIFLLRLLSIENVQVINKSLICHNILTLSHCIGNHFWKTVSFFFVQTLK